MGIVVQKFGGSSVADTEKLFLVCDKIIEEYNSGNKVVVVVSAQGKSTDGLIKEANEINEHNIHKRELDALISTGEQKSASKLCMCLNKRGYKALSLMGWQIPILTDEVFGNARIQSIGSERILQELENDNIVVVAGFQGIDKNNNITTLGRGGSDTTAVAIAASLKATRCDIYTDVDGVYSSDPRIVEKVQKIPEISYDEMLELASMGAKVLHNRCVEIGQKYNIPIAVKSSFQVKKEGTLVGGNIDMEKMCVRGVAKDDNIIGFKMSNLSLEAMTEIFNEFSIESISVDMVVNPNFESSNKNLLFTIKKENYEKAKAIVNSLNDVEVKTYDNISKISIIGTGLVNNPVCLAKVIDELNKNKIQIHMISTSEIRISIVVDKEKADVATNKIHKRLFV